MTRRGSAAKYHVHRVAWLKERPELMEGVPSLSEDVTPEGSKRLSELELQMIEAGLFGRSPLPSRLETVRRLVGELRSGKAVEAYW